MSSEQKLQYPKTMLPTIDYEELENSSFFFPNIVDLEYEVMKNLSNFVEELTEILNQEKMIIIPEIMTSHLFAYLGFLTAVSLKPQKSLKLTPHIQELIESQSNQSYEKFSSFLGDPRNKSKEEKEKQLSQLRNNTPSSIVVQTIRLGRDIWDSLNLLSENSLFYKINTDKNQTKIFCPPYLFIKLLKKHSKKSMKEWKDRLSMLFVINQTALQIGWVIGYFGYYDQTPPEKYLEFGLPCFKLYLEFGIKLIENNK